MKRLLFVFNLFVGMGLFGMSTVSNVPQLADMFGVDLTTVEQSADLVEGRSLQNQLLWDVATNLEKQNLTHLLRLPESLQNFIVEKWFAKNIEKLNSNGCKAGWHLVCESQKIYSKVCSFAVSSDARWFLCGFAGKLEVYDAFNKRCLDLNCHRDAVYSISISKNGKRIVSGSADKTVKVHDLIEDDWVLVKTFESNSVVYGVSVSSDGTRIVYGEGNLIKIYDLVDNAWICTGALNNRSTVYSIMISCDGKRIISGCDKKVMIYDLVDIDWVLKSTLSCHSGWVASLAISSNGNRIISGGPDKLIIYELINGVWVCIDSFVHDVNSLAISSDGKRIVVGCDDGNVFLYNLCDGKWSLVESLYNHAVSITSVTMSDDGKKIAFTGDNDKPIYHYYYTSNEDINLTLPIACAIARDNLTEAEKELLMSSIDFGNLHIDLKRYLRNKNFSNKRNRG